MKKSSSSGLTGGDGYKGNISRRNQKMITPAMNEIEARVIISLFWICILKFSKDYPPHPQPQSHPAPLWAALAARAFTISLFSAGATALILTFR